MAPPLLKIGTLDLSEHIDVQPEDGLQPGDPDAVEPQFAGNLAFREGQDYTGELAGNYEHAYPLVLVCDTRAELKLLVAKINRALVKGARVEYAHDPTVDASTFFEIEGGRCEVAYNYFLATAGTSRATLRVWTLPYGHTGTHRVLASVSATGPQQFVATGVLGDREAFGKLGVRIGSYVGNIADTGNWIAYGWKRLAPSGLNLLFGPTSNGGSVFGASGRHGSQYYGDQTTPTTSDTIVSWDMRPEEAGRYRVLAALSLHFSGAASRSLRVRTAGEGGTQVAYCAVPSVRATGWNMLDLGEIRVGSVATTSVIVDHMGASGASAVATYPARVDFVTLLPVGDEDGAGIVKVGPWGAVFDVARATVTFDAYARSVTVEARRNASLAPAVDRYEADLRGDLPLPPAQGSPIASSPAQFVVVAWPERTANDNTDVRGNDAFDVSLLGLERFTFLV